MQRKFFLAEVPDDMTVMRYIRRKSNFDELEAKVKPRRRYPAVMQIGGIEFDVDRMAACLKEIHATFGLYAWNTADGGMRDYRGFSLVYNPNHRDKLDVHQATLGTPKVPEKDFLYGVESHEENKHSYADSYAFRTPTPAAQFGYLGEFIGQFARTRVRSRVATLYAPQVFNGANRFRFGWHRDETVFENLRMNIPVTTAPEFRFQYEPNSLELPTEENDGLVDIHLELGRLYTWDTFKPHRVFCTQPTGNERTHIVLGFSPWIDYLPEEEAWVFNEFYGEMHPFDMIHEGHVHPRACIEGV